MANKASTDGVVFQYRLCYYVIGLVHDKYDYSVLYEGNEDTYGAMDDVVLKINRNGEGAYNEGLYLIQAKQTTDETKTLSIQDLLLQDKKSSVAKYIDAYITYAGSETCKRDGAPTEMIYWTTNDLHATTKNFVEEHISTEPHLVLTIDSIKKYRIKDWKALLMFDMAQKLANDCKTKSPKKDYLKPFTYLDESVTAAIACEILELVDQSTDSVPKVRFRQQFLLDAPCLSENTRQFRKSFEVACEMIYPKVPTFNIASLNSVTFPTDVFSVENLNASNTNSVACSFQYKGLTEETLNWFFEHFIYYVCVPKDETMVKAIKDLFGDKFDEKMFERYLITEPRKLELKQKKAKKRVPQQDCFISKASIELLLKMIELKGKLVVQPPKGIEFKKESVEELNATINSLRIGEERELTLLSKTKVAWTASRITKEFANQNSLAVSNETGLQQLLEALAAIQTTPFGEGLIIGEVQFIILLDLPDIALCSKQIVEQLVKEVKVIAIVSEQTVSTMVPNVADEIELGDVTVDYEQLEIKSICFDGKKLPVSNFLTSAAIDSIKKVEELSTLTDITAKSDVYISDERHYIDRNLLGEDGKIVTHTELLSRAARTVSIIRDTAGQGKTTELLRIGEVAQNVDGVICMFVRAKTIAHVIMQDDNISALVGLQMLQKLLHITPQSAFVDEIVQQCLEKAQVCLLVDGFDEVVEQYQNAVIKFLVKMLQHAACCSLIIATRHESSFKVINPAQIPDLKKAFKNASYYSLAPFPYDQYFQKLWLSDPNELSPDLEQNVQIFISNFDQLLKGTGCKAFLEVPQLCKIMGTIYHDRIRKPNIQWHTNYEIGSIFDTFVQSQLENTLRGKFDEMDKLHVWATNLIKSEYYTKHAQLAYELEYNCYSNPDHYEQLQRFGLVMIQFDSSESINFMHRTVMDYFLVRICMLGDIDEENFHSFLKRYFCVSRANIADKFIDFFLHDAQCLSSRKKGIINSYLYSGHNILPMCIRMALNNATFNTLRVLLSVAQTELLRPLCFRFGASSSLQGNNSNEINLKRLGERQTLLLLETLKQCDDEYVDAQDDNGDLSILERMLFEANPNEEDTLEVAIRKPFPDVFDWVVAYCIEHFNQQIERYLLERIPRYARAIIRHCYAENKEKIIDKLLQLCKTTFRGESIRQWLQNFDLLGELLDSIEIVPQGKEFKEADRIDLTQKILALLDSYLGEESLITVKEQSSERFDKLQNEAIKSVLKLWMTNDK
ncbi:uncharacterized protein LOC128302015 [Anopheles moucheti]|uniref:uncharacterized protein LOC128302015 n=1 Tax=Anopheles moucheti TaxID=186751 RepID=UPI0022F0561A|nr:uncharacterized protein LOC128302015 [Anopheles moucheti]